jgi:exopolyphosphatase/guanosine-5'-triphosphate,3'-diphosphate pyrophosphatase
LRQKEDKPITRSAIKTVRATLAAISYEDRITRLHLRPDRADVIVPAIDIFVSIMKWAKVKDIYVPQVGLPDGLIRVLYNDYKTKQADG